MVQLGQGLGFPLVAAVVVDFAMRRWVIATLRRASEDRTYGSRYAQLHPDGLVIFFEVRLFSLLLGPASSVFSTWQVGWLYCYSFVRAFLVIVSTALLVLLLHHKHLGA